MRGLKPKHVILNIGTNNLWPTKNARGNTPEEIAEGIRAVIQRLRAKLPETHLTLMGIFPRGQKADDRSRAKVAKVNELLIPLGKENGITFLDLGDKLIEADETIRREVMPDFLHPAEPAYEIWGKALQNIITE